jgi:ligand-binding sensor domain-containing protein/DNA-binding CsgD family transcriptional regulator
MSFLNRVRVGCWRRAGHALLQLLAAALLFLPIAAAEPGFQNISIEDGLSQNTVSCILQDRDHFMWFGSEEGLNRYDGIRFKVFRHERDGRNGLGHDRIGCLLADSDGSLWIGTLGGGLNHLDAARRRFAHFRHDARDAGSLSNDSVRAIQAAGDGSLWIGTDNGLNRFDPRAAKFTRFLHDGANAGIRAPCAITCLYRDRAGVLWIGTRGGLQRYDPAGNRCLALGPGGDVSDGRGEINAIFEDDAGVLWLGTEGGLLRYDRRGGFQSKSGSSATLPHLYRSRIQRILRDDGGGVWIASEAGIYSFPRSSLLDVYFKAGAVPRRLLKDHFILSLYQDPEGILWAGTFSGIYKHDLRTRHFSLCGSEFSDREDARLPVTAVCQDDRGRLWIGTYKNGLLRLQRSVGELKTFQSLPGNPRALKDLLVTALCIDPGRTLWIGTNNGLHAYDTARDSFTGYYRAGERDGGLSSDRVAAIFADRSGRLWVGTENGLNLLDRERRRWTVFRNDLPGAPAGGRDQVYAICQERSGALWIGAYGGGLSRFDPQSGRYLENYRHHEGDAGSLGSDKVYCLLEDSRGRFWVGTNSGGLNLFDRVAGTFTRLSTADGLPNNVILGMLEDNQGRLWLSTSRGLSRFDPQRRIFRNFTARDGLQGNEFFPLSFYKSVENELFFGGVNGLTGFFPGNIRDNPHAPPMVITDVEVFGRSQTYAGGLEGMNVLELGPGDRTVSFAFAALSYSDPARNRYAYRIDGLHDDWVEIGNRHEITVSNLRPGKYVFRVKGANNHGVWNELGAALAIRMRPPWWQSWWFRVPAFLLLLVLLVFLNRTRTRRLAARIRSEAAMEKFYEKYGISPREREIVHLLLKGKSNKEIEDALFISMGTVKNHVYSIYQKIGVKNRAQLITLFKNLQVK